MLIRSRTAPMMATINNTTLGKGVEVGLFCCTATETPEVVYCWVTGGTQSLP